MPVAAMFIFFVIFAYLIGSVSSAIVVAKLCKLPDPRSEGSGNPGATNMLRLGGKKLAVIVLIGDLLKGLLPVLIARYFILSDYLGWIGLAAVLGHLYPVFFKFKGGKGVATSVGVILVLSLPLSGLAIGTWILMAVIFRYSSLAAIVATFCLPFYTFWLAQNQFIPLLIMSLLVLYRHYDNMRRLLSGQESKIGKST